MSSDIILLIIYFVIAIGFSFYCSVAEAALLSISPSYIATLGKTPEDETPDPNRLAVADRLARLKNNVDRPLAAILSLNTIAHTIGAAGVGAQAAKIWSSNANAVGIAGALMTLAILIFSEIIPKTIGALYWRQLASPLSRTIEWLILILYPLVWVSEVLTKILSGGKPMHAVTREEFSAMADLGVEHGLLEEQQSKTIRNLMRMREVTVDSIRTPRPVLIAYPQTTTVNELIDQFERIPVSRIPIHENDIDKITGFVLRSDLLLAAVEGHGDTPLSQYRRDVLSIPATTELLTLMETLTRENAHLAIVVDEFGGTDGVVTLEDLVETLFGIEIVDESDTTEDLQKRAREHWNQRAQKIGLPIDGSS